MKEEEMKVVADEVKKSKGKTYMFFIGAGFSVPAGLPTASVLNSKIVEADKLQIGAHSDGTIYRYPIEYPPISHHHDVFLFGMEVIKRYCDNDVTKFDYEKFYEYLYNLYTESINKEISSRLEKEYKIQGNSGKPGIKMHSNLMTFNFQYPKLVHYFLHDTDDIDYSQYNMLMLHLRRLVEQGNKVEIYSLNHDTIVEELIVEYGLSDCFCDGFSNVDSPFYDGTQPLEQFTNLYDKPIRLHKLHGSTSYYAFAIEKEKSYYEAVNLIKYPFRKDDRKLRYIASNDSYRILGAMLGLEAEFLTGTTSKAKRYEAPIYYKPQFKNFERDLMKADEVYVIGYGFKDEKVNDIIKYNINKDAKCVVIDPFINDLAVSKAEEILPNLPPPVRQSVVDVDWSENCCK